MKIPARPKSLLQLVEALGDRLTSLLGAGLSNLPEDKYLHWDALRFKPAPEGLSHEEWWFALKLSRSASMQSLPFQDESGRAFQFGFPPYVLRMLHMVDRDASGRIELPEVVTNPQTRDRFLVRSLIEEAITSSQLEGAATTRKDAKEMLRQGRKPRTRGEQMIMNNYRAMELIRESYDTPLTTEFILELHRTLTHDTLDDATAAGRWRRSDEGVSVVDQRDNTELHVPPPADQLPSRIERLLTFANGGDDGPFIHPVIRSILIHFMVGYDHPFADGNGRTARALFYWSMARHGYWMMEFTSISSILRKAPASYARSFLYTETDDNDTTYFIVYQLEVILRAIKSLHSYLARKTREIREADAWLRDAETLGSILNHRQVALIQHALKHLYEAYTVKSHMRSHNVTYETARSDLLTLNRHQLLERSTRGRAHVFSAPYDLRERLEVLETKQPPRHSN